MKPLNENILKPDFTSAGTNLVEASAGTGKTYCIQTLYLRLLVEQGLTVQQILVVTFTEAATKELRDRLRQILEQALTVNNDSDLRVKEVMALSPLQGERRFEEDPAEKRWRVQRALLDFDEAAISTIHGFCRRVLDRYAFECGTDPEMELVGGDSSVIDKACEDWWRQHVYGDLSRARLAANSKRFTLDLLTKVVSKRMAKPDAQIRGTQNPNASNLHQACNDAVQYLKDKRDAIQQDMDRAIGEGYLNPLFPGLVDYLADVDVSDSVSALPQLLFFSREKFTPLQINSRYRMPQKVTEFIELCRETSQLKGDLKISQTDENWNPPDNSKWNQQLENLRTMFLDVEDELNLLIQNDLPFMLKKSADKLGDVAKVKGWFASLQDPVSRAKNLPTALTAFKDLKANTKIKFQASELTKSFRVKCEELKTLMDCHAEKELLKALDSVVKTCETRKGSSRSMTFDDLLLRVRESLNTDGNSEGLLNALQKEYKAALIDEFQDTDPVQYDIFRKVFIEGVPASAVPIYFVGDPKQAIYAFRNGDIYTYYAAKGAVNQNQIWNLDTNYRSEKRLVDAVNQIFRDSPDTERTFVEEIPYPGTLKSGRKSNEPDLVTGLEPKPDNLPFKLKFYTGLSSNEPPGQNSPFARRVYQDTSEEVVKLLSTSNENIGSEAVKPADIAILVRTHREAAMIQRELNQRGVPAVCQSTGKIFETEEARSFAHVLAAIAEPRNAKRVRTALATAFFDVSHQDLIAMNEASVRSDKTEPVGGPLQPTSFEEWMDLFQQAHERWQKRSFIQAFHFLSARSCIRQTLLTLEGGERSLTNLLQLCGVLHEAVTLEHLSIEAALSWYARQLEDPSSDQRDEMELRLEKDDQAVRILTIFTSKGLEFPIVFVPTLWRMKAESRESFLEYHDENDKLLIDLDKENNKSNDQAKKEKLAEQIRQTYVALTRAKHRTYLVWGDFKAPEDKYSLASILGSDPEERLKSKLDADESLAIEMQKIPFPGNPADVHRYEGAIIENENLQALTKPEVDKSKRHTSFSGLVPHGAKTHSAVDERYDFDAPDAVSEEVSPPTSASDELTIYTFPAGAKVGQCWHSIFEEIDFTADDETLREKVDEMLGLYRLDRGPTEEAQRQKRDLVHQMLKNTLSAELTVDAGDSIQLNLIPPSNCRAEMQFDFALRDEGSGGPGSLKEIREILQTFWKDRPDRQPLLDALQGMDREIPQGFLTGFIDLVFRHEDKYFILDWKSNRRGGTPEDFQLPGLIQEMGDHLYFLQYLIYTVALHQFLRGSMGDNYSYDEHFGGVFYVFLRATKENTSCGIYGDRPPQEMIEKLSECIGRFA